MRWHRCPRPGTPGRAGDRRCRPQVEAGESRTGSSLSLARVRAPSEAANGTGKASSHGKSQRGATTYHRQRRHSDFCECPASPGLSLGWALCRVPAGVGSVLVGCRVGWAPCLWGAGQGGHPVPYPLGAGQGGTQGRVGSVPVGSTAGWAPGPMPTGCRAGWAPCPLGAEWGGHHACGARGRVGT